MKSFIFRLIFKPSETERICLDQFIEISSKSLSSQSFPKLLQQFHVFILCSGSLRDKCLALDAIQGTKPESNPSSLNLLKSQPLYHYTHLLADLSRKNCLLLVFTGKKLFMYVFIFLSLVHTRLE